MFLFVIGVSRFSWNFQEIPCFLGFLFIFFYPVVDPNLTISVFISFVLISSSLFDWWGSPDELINKNSLHVVVESLSRLWFPFRFHFKATSRWPSTAAGLAWRADQCRKHPSSMIETTRWWWWPLSFFFKRAKTTESTGRVWFIATSVTGDGRGSTKTTSDRLKQSKQPVVNPRFRRIRF